MSLFQFISVYFSVPSIALWCSYMVCHNPYALRRGNVFYSGNRM